MRIGLLGTLTVHGDTGQQVRIGGHRVRLLLIALAIDAGRVVPAYSLIDRLWDADPPANAANALQSAISRLRACLRAGNLGDELIESHPVGYRLAIPPGDVDAVAFEELAGAGRRALESGDPAAARPLLREALAGWRGPALADAEGMEFAAGLAARLTEARERAALDLIEAGLALGETEQPIAGLRALTAADPLAERPRGLLMRALAGSGRRAEALALYEQTRDLLADRLGVDPSPRLERIYLDILRQDLDHAPEGEPGREPTAGRDAPGPASQRTGAGDPPPGAAIRRPLTSFVGREDDIARVLAMLAGQRLVTLTGPGGAGKTRLAVELAAGLADDPARWPWRPWFVDLTPVADTDDVPFAVLHALGVRDGGLMARSGSGPPAAPADPVTRLAAVLGSGEHLLILDNCEHVVGAAAALAEELLARCPAARILATSREPLRIGGERLWPVSPLPEPAALRLLTDRAAAVRPDFAADESNAADLARICRALDGMPLAIELAAARLRVLPPAQLAARLDARFQVLTTGSRTAAERHQTLWAVVDWSWELLSAPEQLLARRLAMFAGGATLTAAEQVCQDADLPGEAILPGLLGLVEKSFLVADDAADPDGDPRYTMLETIRAYCAQRLADSGEEPAVRRRFAGHFLDLAQTADPLLRGARQRPWMRRLAAEQDNIGAAVRWALDNHEPDLALRFGQALSWFWLLRGQRREIAALAEEILAVSAPPDGQEPGSGDAATAAARAVCALIALNSNWNLDGLRQPLVAAERLVLTEVRARRAGEGDRCRYHPLVLLAAIMVPLYDRHDADQALDLIVAHFDAPDPWTRWAARAMHSIFALSLGRTADVARECAEALVGFRALGDRWGTALTLTSRAELAMLAGDFAAAIADLEEAVSLGRELTDWQDTAQMHAYLAKSRSRLGDRQAALADLEQAERIVRANGDPSGDLWIYYIRAELAWLAGDLAEAGAICRKLEAMLPDTSPMIWSFRALVEARRGLADLRSGGAGDGAGTLFAALGHARDSMDRSAVATVLDALAAAVLAGPDPGVPAPGRPDPGVSRAEQAAAVLGAAHAVRGAFDHASLDAPDARAAARRVLGDAGFAAAYQRGLDLTYDAALALGQDAAGQLLRR